LEKLRRERSQRREKLGNVKMQLQDAQRSGKLVIEAEDLSQSYGGRTLFKEFTTLIQRRDRIGVIGPNGCGKSTLLSILLGKNKPDTGEVTLGTNLEVAYFDQLRSQLDEESTVLDNVGQGSDFVEIGSERKHIMGYLQDFLFTPERSRTPVKALSGGERNRLLLAKLFTQPANLLVMDEPTNDLDAETLDLLEDLLMNYHGTLLLVSHDRAFLNNVATSTIVFDDDGQVREYVGGYDDWVHQRQQDLEEEIGKSKAVLKKVKSGSKKSALTYQEQLDLTALPKKIEKLELKQAELLNRVGQPEFYQQEAGKITEMQEQLAQLTGELEDNYNRWQQLEAKQENN
jgi:ATP-binding cassette subfamily F protein uup